MESTQKEPLRTGTKCIQDHTDNWTNKRHLWYVQMVKLSTKTGFANTTGTKDYKRS